MKESNWNDCIECSSALKISVDPKKAKSLIEVAEGRIEYLTTNTIKEDTANYIFEGYYASILEYMHSVAFSRGFKIILIKELKKIISIKK